MIIDAIRGIPWAIRQAKMDEITAFLEARVTGEILPEMFKTSGKSGNKADQAYEVQNGTAIIPVMGTLSKRMNMFSDFSGGTSTELLKKDIEAAMQDRSVTGILLDIESPGGTVDGTSEIADFISTNRGRKPIVAYANGLMASAAYWIGSACDAIVANDTAIVGSIGVAMTHSANVNDSGVKKTDIYAGKYKRIASSNQPLTEEGKAYLQSQVDAIYSIFVEAVAKNRGVSVEKALTMADGKEFIGKQAQEVGLVDIVGTRDTALSLIQKRSVKSMDLKILQEKHPDLYSAVKQAGRDEATAEAMQKGVDQERNRVTEILSADGDMKTAISCIKDGVPVADSFKRLFEAERNGRAEKLQAMKNEAPKSVGQEAPKNGSSKTTFEAEIDKLISSGKSRSEAMKMIISANPGLHEEYLNRINKVKE